MTDFPIDPSTAALLVMDFQTAILERYAAAQDDLLPATARAIAAARAGGMAVIYVVVGFRPGFPEISPRNRTFSAIGKTGGIPTTIHNAVAPRDNEIVITKHRVGAFMGTDLDMILRAQNVDTLVLCGVATSGVVLSTLRHAADADYRIAVLRDCCGDMDSDVHSCLLDKIFVRQATILDSRLFADTLGKSG